MWVFSSDKNMLFSVMFGVIIAEEKGFIYHLVKMYHFEKSGLYKFSFLINVPGRVTCIVYNEVKRR